MNTKIILQEVAILRREIEEIKNLNLEFWNSESPSITDRTLFEARQNRLAEIHNRLRAMLGQPR
jgi:FtsZ-binding cell division protein ZapB